MMSDKVKKQVLDSFLEIIDAISDEQYQEKAWIRGEEGVDFDEIVNLFSDLGDPILDKYKQFGITEDQYQLLKRFRDEFYAFADENDWPPDFIDTPEWKKITAMAKEVLRAFGSSIS